jgi:hypothetical protein
VVKKTPGFGGLTDILKIASDLGKLDVGKRGFTAMGQRS